ncbi:cyclic AMP-responsive element-binding protein 3-like protein 3-B [Triplophysa rosa]|uniref:Cyclic AMP-responsive element-binding protein 3-like protein 3-A n=1 Tax=Triplophysa rosa TaxID=992332 RepID=A0A9W8C6P3_TRIRA|nr:cyclic AMP-responsive element-binding protein 3-like protein 3-B [Triplophysa rosa]KAI7809306.1 putative cyclic AMP-responsive element-binding protein 3-like protein 3-A [Triplophysa rosa]
MALLSDGGYWGMELLDFLLEQPHRNAHMESHGDHGNPVWTIAEQSALSHGEGAVGNFLDSLLHASDGVSNPCSPLWVPSPCDSGISDDTPSDHLDSPLPPNHVILPHQAYLHPPHQQREEPSAPAGNMETDFSIDLGDWEACLFPAGLTDSQCITTAPRIQPNQAYQLSVKDLLLSNIGEPSNAPSQQSQQELILSEDEKKLLAKEGVSLSSQMPLNKYEEKILKKIRRKIRNKQSAQESRKKKKEYVDGLEDRMAACTTQNLELQKKVFQLEKTNVSLMEQLRRLQALVMNSSCKPAQTGTCILVLVLSFSLILIPNLHPGFHRRATDPGDISAAKVQSRSLRSVMEVYSIQPGFSVGGDVVVPSSPHTKLLRPEYADMEPLLHNHSYRDHEHHHGDPITGHATTLSWL